MSSRIRRIGKISRSLAALALGLGLTTGMFLLLQWPVQAAPPPTYRYVATTGNDYLNSCTSSALPCRTVQRAVDVAGSTDIILVAQGAYTDLHTRPVPGGYMAPPAGGVITQVLYVGKTVTIRGGYTADFAEPPDPSANATTLQVPAGQRGRVLVIVGDVQPVLRGLRFVDGDATGLGGGWGSRDAGGGVYILTATATLDTNAILSSVAYDGGGLYLVRSAATLIDNLITENSASGGSGGGLYLHASDAILRRNTLYTNFADLHGGGAFLDYSNAELTGNTLFSNRATGSGGGLFLKWYSAATLTGNTIESNNAGYQGGGVYLNYSNAVLDANIIESNTAGANGGGLALGDSGASLMANVIVSNEAGACGGGVYIRYGDPGLDSNIVRSNLARWGGGVYLENSKAVLTNTVVIENQAPSNGSGSGLHIVGSAPRLLHTTISLNSGGDGSAIYVTDEPVSGSVGNVALTNTILAYQRVGITVTVGNTATLEGMLLYANSINLGGEGSLSYAHEVWGDPHFSADGYHLSSGSAALNAGVSAGVTTDIDDDPRPYCTAPDLGADEAVGDFACHYVYLPAVLKNH